MQSRIRIFFLVFTLFFALLIARLFYWQIIKGKQLAEEARKQHQTELVITAPRGNILAKDGTWLVARGESWLVYAALPDLTYEKDKIADRLALLLLSDEDGVQENDKALLNEASRIKSLLKREEVVWVPIKHKVSSQIKVNIKALNINGIGFEPEETRIYPEASSAAHLLGFVGKNTEGADQGYFGLEGYYDLVLSGKPGFVVRDSDARGIPILLGDSRETFAAKGVDLLTHVDKSIQLNLDKKLLEGIKRYGASGGTAIVMDPKTGGIMGISSYPSYDPGKYNLYGNEFFINPAVSLSFEPGSIFKVLIMASALDAGVVKPDTKCDICSGPVRVDKYSIETWNNKYRPDSTMAEVILHSDNVGMVFVGSKLGSDKMYDYLDSFGIGKITEIDLQGEMSPKLRDKDTWSVVDLATVSFGQGIAITPIQMITAVAAVANKGVLLTPQVVDKIVVDSWEEDIKRKEKGQVISEKTAAQVTAMMVEAAKNGEAKWTYSRGFKVAGKTGTAQIPIAGHYDNEKTIASFIGFAPADDPKFIMLVTLHEPETSPWASETAAPLWYLIAKDLFLYFGIQPEN